MSEVKYNKDGSIRKKVGRPKKEKIQLPEEIQKLIDDTTREEHEQFEEIKQEVTQSIKKEGDWDVKKDEPILFFDKRLSYELTGYRPITETEGLDFNPSWFTEARDRFKATKKYCAYLRNSKGYREFWNEEYRRCREGLTVNGYTLTGFNYYFLNYYQLDSTDTDVAGTGRGRTFPSFYVYQYEFFHYFELCRHLRRNLAEMKNRGC